MIDIRAHRQKMTGNEPDAKAILPKPRSVQKANSYQYPARPTSPISRKENLQKALRRIKNPHLRALVRSLKTLKD